MWKVTQIPEGQQVLTSTVKALKCREHERYAVHNVWSFLLRYFHKLIHVQKLYPEAHFPAESIAASPVVIGQKTAKLFRLLYSPTQRGPTIALQYLCFSFKILVTIHWPVSGISEHVPCSIKAHLYSVNCFTPHFMLHTTVAGRGVPKQWWIYRIQEGGAWATTGVKIRKSMIFITYLINVCSNI